MKILYFIKSSAPTVDEALEIETLGFPVMIRNGHYAASPRDMLEVCDGVLGEVPKRYSHLPNGSEVMAAHKAKKLKELNDLRESKPAKVQAALDKGQVPAVEEKTAGRPRKGWGTQE